MSDELTLKRLMPCLTAIGLVSMAIVAYQIGLMETLSIIQWHHFASTIIAIALLGFGASGTCLALMRGWLLKHYTSLMPLIMGLCGLTMALAVPLAQIGPVRFDSFLLFAEPWHSLRLLATGLIYCVPFFLGALAIGLAFMQHARAIKILYCANLIGSGLGALVALMLMQHFLPEAMPTLIALLPVFAGIIMAAGARSRLAALLALALVVWMMYHPPALVMSQFKALQKAMDIPGSVITSTTNSPLGLMYVVRSSSLRYAPGVSLVYQGELPIYPVVFKNGDWFGPVMPRNPSTLPTILDYTTGALAYELQKPRRVLVLDAATGAETIQALSHGAHVQAVEANPLALELLSDLNAGSNRLEVFPSNSRTFLMRDHTTYDLIILPMIDSFGGTSGLAALSENYLLTLQAFELIWQRLAPGGMMCVSCWLDTPPRNSLKLVATAATVLTNLGADPRRHLLAVKGWGTFTLVMKRSAITPHDITAVRSFCERLAFDPVILPGLEHLEGDLYHQRQDERWSNLLAAILSGKGESIAYDFNILPATDDRPYFGQFLTFKSLPRLQALYGTRSIPFFELSNLILIMTSVFISLAAGLLILVPLLKTRPVQPIPTFIYFGGIAVGFFFVEIALIQHATLYLGIPLYAAAIIIGGLLFFSGCGSLASGMLRFPVRYFLAAPAALIIIYTMGLSRMLGLTIAAPLGARIIIILMTIAPLAFCMGMPFPLGISMLPPEDIPWAWGVNGCLSVVAAPLASIIAVKFGFTWVMLLAGLAYAMAMLAVRAKEYT